MNNSSVCWVKECQDEGRFHCFSCKGRFCCTHYKQSECINCQNLRAKIDSTDLPQILLIFAICLLVLSLLLICVCSFVTSTFCFKFFDLGIFGFLLYLFGRYAFEKVLDKDTGSVLLPLKQHNEKTRDLIDQEREISESLIPRLRKFYFC